MLGHSPSIAPGSTGLICGFFLFSLEIYDCFKTKNQLGRGWFEALHCSCTQLAMVKWEKSMATLARMFMNITVMQSFECNAQESMRLTASKNHIFHKKCFNRFELFHHVQRKIIMSQRKITISPLNRIVSLSDFYDSCNDPFTWRLQK